MGLILRFNPQKVTKFPSSNPNTIEIVNGVTTLESASLEAAKALFKSLGISKFFVLLGPSQQQNSIELQLKISGFKQYQRHKIPCSLENGGRSSNSEHRFFDSPTWFMRCRRGFLLLW